MNKVCVCCCQTKRIVLKYFKLLQIIAKCKLGAEVPMREKKTLNELIKSRSVKKTIGSSKLYPEIFMRNIILQKMSCHGRQKNKS